MKNLRRLLLILTLCATNCLASNNFLECGNAYMMSMGLYSTTIISISCEQFKAKNIGTRIYFSRKDSIKLSNLLLENIKNNQPLQKEWSPDARCVVYLGCQEFCLSSTLLSYNNQIFDLNFKVRTFLDSLYELNLSNEKLAKRLKKRKSLKFRKSK